MPPETEFDTFLQVDRDNLEEGRRFFEAFDSNSLPTVDLISSTLQQAADLLGTNTLLPQKEHDLGKWASSMGLPFREAYELLSSATLVGESKGPDPTGQAHADLHDATSFVARCYLVLRLKRDFFFGLSDLMKNRVVAGLGYLRVQAESVGFATLISAKPELGAKWLGAHHGDAGRELFRKHHSQVVEKIRELNLYFHYDMASGNSLHSRIGGVSYGIMAGTKNKDPGDRSIRLVYQDLDNSVVYFLWFASFLRFHERVLLALSAHQPELSSEPEFADSCARVTTAVDALWDTLRPQYEELRSSGVPDALLHD